MSLEVEIKQLEHFVTNKIPLSPSAWLDIIGRVVVEMSEETDKLYALQKEVANMKIDYMKEFKSSMATAKTAIEATNVYEAMQRQKAKCLKIEELVRIGKLQSKLKENEYSAGSL